jgi:hypothetical protein
MHEDLSHTLQSILLKLSELDSKVSVLTAKNRRTADPNYIPVSAAATFCGRTLKGFQTWLSRCSNDPDKPVVKRLHGRVHRGDLQRLVESCRKRGRGEIVSEALDRSRP